MTWTLNRRMWHHVLAAGFLAVVSVVWPAGGARAQPAVSGPPAAAAPGAPDAAAGGLVRDCEECPDLVPVKPGEFMMGAPASDKEASARSVPSTGSGSRRRCWWAGTR